MNPFEQGAAKPKGSKLSTGLVGLLCFIAAFSVLLFGTVDPPAQSLIAILSFFLILLWGIDSLNSGVLRLSKNSLQFPLTGLVLLGLFQLLPFGKSSPVGILSVSTSAALSADPHATLMFTVRLVICLVFLAAAATYLNTSGRIRAVAIFLISFGTVMAFFGIIQKLADPGAIYGLRPTPQAIPFGSYVNQHHFASLMVMLLGPTAGYLLAGKARRDLFPLLLIAAVMMTLAVFFTGSRGGVLSFCAMTVAVLFLSARYRRVEEGQGQPLWFRKVAVSAGIATFALLIIVVAVLLGAGQNLIRGLGLSGGVDDISSGRLHFWYGAWKIFAEDPIIGAGLDSFGVAFTAHDTRNGFFRVEQAHNDYLQILADGGIVGFILVVLFVFFLIRSGLRAISNTDHDGDRGLRIGTLAGCIGVLVHSIFDFPLRTNSNAYIFLLLAVIATTSVRAAKKRRSLSRATEP